MIGRLLCWLGLHDWRCIYERRAEAYIFREGWGCMRPGCEAWQSKRWNT
jgi:hypothetical protein